ncbi:unnamed protein product, partial [Mesorhabditis belari]|uniref:Uncharacterized protein n=1 Tax=Mesorhabditis belari TaxID=2138241 RepID=A0AAF3EEV8_9BILA
MIKGYFLECLLAATFNCATHRGSTSRCSECGLVVGDRIGDVGTEWRSFSGENSGNDPSRVGAPENHLFTNCDLSTYISVGHGASTNDQSLTTNQRKIINYADRQMNAAIGTIRDMSDRIHIIQAFKILLQKPSRLPQYKGTQRKEQRGSSRCMQSSSRLILSSSLSLNSP